MLVPWPEGKVVQSLIFYSIDLSFAVTKDSQSQDRCVDFTCIKANRSDNNIAAQSPCRTKICGIMIFLLFTS